MLRYLKSLSELYIICYFLLSCKEFPCYPAISQLALISFSDVETDTLILRRYAKATNFTTLIDTFLINRSNSTYFKSNDTLRIFNLFGGDQGLKSKYDYEIYVPQLNRLFRITDIVEEFNKTRSGPGEVVVHCSDPIKSYKLNGQLITGNYNYYMVYIRK
jgi:hypothetical protein